MTALDTGLLEVPADGLRAGVVPGGHQPVPFGQHRRDHTVGHRPRRRVRAAGAGLERGVTLGPVAGHQLRDPPLGDPVATGDLGLGETLDGDGGDDQLGFGHPLIAAPPSFLCLETCVSYVLRLDSAGGSGLADTVQPTVARGCGQDRPRNASYR